jgi:hypothetical protein
MYVAKLGVGDGLGTGLGFGLERSAYESKAMNLPFRLIRFPKSKTFTISPGVGGVVSVT